MSGHFGRGRAGLAALCVAALLLSACTTSALYGEAAPRTALSSCLRDALTGAETEYAAACAMLSPRDLQRVENAYYTALASDGHVSNAWESDAGGGVHLEVAAPTAAERPRCRTLSATISDGVEAAHPLPPETFCPDADGQWAPS